MVVIDKTDIEFDIEVARTLFLAEPEDLAELRHLSCEAVDSGWSS
jgi:hypothetical protein